MLFNLGNLNDVELAFVSGTTMTVVARTNEDKRVIIEVPNVKVRTNDEETAEFLLEHFRDIQIKNGSLEREEELELPPEEEGPK